MTAQLNSTRRFLYEVLLSGLEFQAITPDDVLLHVTPEVLAHHLPIALKAKLLQASLSSERMNPALVVEVVGVEAMAEHMPQSVLWACVRSCAARQLGQDDVASAALAAVAAAMPAVGSNAIGAMTDDLQLKPTKTARPMALRPGSSPPPRISALSPRSQVVRRTDAPPSASPSGSFDIARGDDPPDFEIVEETEVPARRRGEGDDTRPGTKT